MLEWMAANLATLIISLLMLLLTGTIVVRLVKRRRRGETACGSCSGCASKPFCQANGADIRQTPKTR